MFVRTRVRWLIASAALASATLFPQILSAQQAPRDLDTYHLFTQPANLKAWEARRQQIRTRILFSSGLWPMPEKTPLNAVITGEFDGGDYIVQNIAMESRPGFYLCGNLYKPKTGKGPFPAIVNPHGHWTNGRKEMQPDVDIAPPVPGKMGLGRGNLVAIGVNLARHGMVCFAYDAVGYNDTSQARHYEFTKSLTPWFWSVDELGLQLWDSIRVTDYLSSLKFVDKNKIGATGASGGGSQTFLLTAVDDRIKCAVPVNMVSAIMQGGCLCENGPGLRVGTDNVEIAATFAPKPMLLVAATGDWTRNNPTEEWPAIQKVYNLYNAGDKTAVKQFNYQHNYNVESREAMCAWFGKWFLNDPDASHFKERPFVLNVDKLTVWTAKHPMPKNALSEEALTAAMIEERDHAWKSLLPQNSSDLKRFRSIIEPALRTSLAIDYVAPAPKHVRGEIWLQVTDRDHRINTFSGATLPYQFDAPLVKIDYWKDYYTTYNQTHIGEVVERLMKEIVALHNKYGTIDIDAFSNGGVWAILATSLLPQGYIRSVRTYLDILPGDGNRALEELYYAPGLRAAGDIRSAIVLSNADEVLIYGANPALDIKDAIEARKASGGKITVIEPKATK